MKATKSIPKNGHLGPKLDARRAALLEDIRRHAPSCLRVFEQAYDGKSLRAAVNAHCLECFFFDRQGIGECSASQCGLWAVRPYQRRGVGFDEHSQ